MNMSQKERLKKIVILLLGCITIAITVIIHDALHDTKRTEQTWSSDRMKEYSTDTISADCIICQEKRLYENEDNLGIICLNECTAYHVEINRYDVHGQLIEKKATSMQLLMSPKDENNKGIQIETDSNRGLANVDISFTENKEIDMQKATEHCCPDCLKLLTDEYYSVEPYDIAILNYKTGKVKLLTSNLRSFMLGDYYVTCEQRSSIVQAEISEIDLLVMYCPERYQ